MNCGTFELVRIARAVSEYIRAGEEKHCANCLQPLLELDIKRAAKVEDQGYCCPHCGEKVCVICGCTEQHACAGGCYWLGPGLCSAHSRQLDEALARHGITRTADRRPPTSDL